MFLHVVLLVLLVALAARPAAASTTCVVSGRYAGHASGFRPDGVYYQAIGWLDFDPRALETNGLGYTIVDQQWMPLPTNGTYALVAGSKRHCEILLNLTVANTSVHLRGFVGARGGIFVADETENSSVQWELHVAPSTCSRRSVFGTYTGAGVIHPGSATSGSSSSGSWKALAGTGFSSGNGNATVSYFVSGGGDGSTGGNTTTSGGGTGATTLQVAFTVRPDCILNATEFGFLGSVFNTGVALLGPWSDTEVAGGVFVRNAR